jgi:hypothetical protein
MKLQQSSSKWLITLLIILASTQLGRAADVWSLTFESAGGYTTTPSSVTQETTDYFGRLQESEISASFTNDQGTYFFAAQDIDGVVEAPSLPVYLNVDDADISGYTGLSFSVYLAEDDDSANQDWDSADSVRFYYDIDNTGIWKRLIWVESSGTTNTEPAIDTDFDGVGDGTAISAAFTQFSASISGTGSVIDIRVSLALNSGDEDIALDNLLITGTAAGGVADPSGFSVSPSSSSQLDLTWTENGSSNDILIAWNSSNTFGTPVDGNTYAASASIPDGGTSLGTDADEAYSHTSLAANTLYYYKIWSVDGSTDYSSGVTGSATTNKIEPTNHVTSFSVVKDGSSGHSAIDLSWTANDGSQAPDGYLIKASTADNITDPSDGTAVADNATIGSNSGAENITHGTNLYEWTGLSAEQTYYFKVYPYTNSGTAIDYKTAATVPNGSATTDVAPVIPALLISEVADPSDVANSKFVEIYNATESSIDLSAGTWYLSRQSNGGSWGDLALSGTIAAGDFFVIAYNQTTFESTYSPITADQYSSTASSNGDDGYFIYYGGTHLTGDLADAYGVIDEDGTGKDWEFLDSRAYRNGVSSGNTTWTSSEWVIPASATASACTPGALDGDQSLPVELSIWKATSTHGLVKLFWTTDSEIENQGFIIARSGGHLDKTWTEIASFTTNSDLLGQGSTTNQNDYTFIDKQVKVGKTYSYRLSDVDYQGNVVRHDEIKVTVKDAGIDLKPSDVKLHNAFPNPFNPDVNLSFTLENEVEGLSLEIYDIQGALVQILSSGYHEIGNHDFRWNGFDGKNNAVPSGIYLVRLSAGSVVQVQRVTLLR